MNVVEQIKNHSLYAFVVLLIPIIVGVWYLSEALRVNPLNQRIEYWKEQSANKDRLKAVKADLEKQVETLNEKVTAQNRQISSLNEQVNDLVAKLATKEQSSSTNLKTPDPSKPPPPGVSESPGILSQTKPDSLETSPQKSTPGSQISKQEPTSSAQPSQKKDALNSPIQTRFDGIVVSIIRFEKTGGLVMLQLMAQNTSGPRRTVCFYPRGTQLIHEATGQSWQPKEYTGQECTQLEANQSSHIWMRFDVAKPENKIFSLSSPLFNETLDNLVLAESS